MIGVMTPEQEQLYLLRYLAKKSKELYRDSLVLKAVQEYLKENQVTLFESIVEECRASKEVEVTAALFDLAIESKMPPSFEVDEDQALRKWIQDQGLDQGTRH
jgi:hypothetical protein